MNDTVISVRNLGKRYRLGATLSGNTLREKLAHVAAPLFRPARRPESPAPAPSEFWALRNASFDISRGEVVGIIGRNGAGKSTLLKILSQITEPTEGEVRMRGRVGSLLEVGTGMHPELSGRENVSLNGAILGMRQAEIRAKYDEIVDFAGIPDFMETPIKRYSSGMRVRLGFAIAAHLEPEVLIVDEVLAVGDLNFQKKCLGKMGSLAGAGRTVLFVSHRTEAIRSLCTRAILLRDGQIVTDGPASDTVQAYHRSLRDSRVTADASIHGVKNRRGSGAARLTGVRVRDAGGDETFAFPAGDDIRFELDYEVFQPIPCLNVLVGLRESRTLEMVTTSRRHVISHAPLPPGTKGSVAVTLRRPPLRPGEYPLYFGLADDAHCAFDVVDDLLSPLLIGTDKTAKELGYDPSKPAGYFDVDSECAAETPAADAGVGNGGNAAHTGRVGDVG